MNALDPVRVRAGIGEVARRSINAGLVVARDLAFLRMRAPREPARIVVHFVGNIGDIVVGTPTLIALRERFPRATITLLTSAGPRGLPGAFDLLDGAPHVDRIETYALEDLRARGGAAALLGATRRLAPDLLIMLPTADIDAVRLLRNLAFGRLAGASFVEGLSLTSPPLWVRDRAASGPMVHEVQRLLSLLRPLGIVDPPIRFEFAPTTADERARVAAFVPGGARVVALCPGGKQLGHLWPADRFSAVARRLSDQFGLGLVAIGSGAERGICQAVLDGAGGGMNAAGELSIRSTAELLSRAALLVTNDTGPMHLAAAVGTRVAAIFGSRDFAGRWYPYGQGHEIFRARRFCETCFRAPTLTDHCVRSISIDDVLAGCSRILGASPRSPARAEA